MIVVQSSFALSCNSFVGCGAVCSDCDEIFHAREEGKFLIHCYWMLAANLEYKRAVSFKRNRVIWWIMSWLSWLALKLSALLRRSSVLLEESLAQHQGNACKRSPSPREKNDLVLQSTIAFALGVACDEGQMNTAQKKWEERLSSWLDQKSLIMIWSQTQTTFRPVRQFDENEIIV